MSTTSPILPEHSHPDTPADAARLSQAPGLCRASDLLRRRRRRPSHRRLLTGIDPLDRLLGGGLAHGVLTEVVGRPSGGRLSALLGALNHITSSGEIAALVDQGNHLDPRLAADIGIDLTRVLWIRPRCLPDTLAAAELLVATGFTLVAIDLGLPPVRGRANPAAWIRLARRANEHGAATLVASPYRVSGCAAGTILSMRQTRGIWQGRTGEPRVLAGLSSILIMHKHLGQSCEATARLELTLPEAAIGRETHESIEHTKEPQHVQTL